MQSVWVYRRVEDDEPIGEIMVFKHRKDAKKKMIADFEKFFGIDFDTLKETADEYCDLHIGDNEITFEIDRWEIFKRRIRYVV